MRKKSYIIVVLVLLSAAAVMLDAEYKNQKGVKNARIVNAETITPEEVTPLITNVSYAIGPGEALDGWFAEQLKKELGIEVLQAEYPACLGSLWDCQEDLCCFNSPEGYYDAVKNGQLRDLEAEIEKRPEIYQRYRGAIDQMKKDTYENTGKRGVFGFPMHMHSFGGDWLEGHCLVIPEYASHPEEAMELIAYSATDDGIMNLVFGPERQMWEKQNGRYVLLQDFYNDDSSEKFVTTRDGLEEYVSAMEYLQLAGNDMLGQELLAMTLVNRREDL